MPETLMVKDAAERRVVRGRASSRTRSRQRRSEADRGTGRRVNNRNANAAYNASEEDPPRGRRMAKSQCVVTVIDNQSRQGRDPFARPGMPGNRWMQLGCDGAFPTDLQKKLERAVDLAYQLGHRKTFVENFDKILAKTAKGQPKSYLDSLNAMTLNFAEGSSDPTVQKELKEALEAKRQDPKYQIEGGFTLVATGAVYLREFALKGWSEQEIAGLISHEATHVAGAPGDLITEIVLAGLDAFGYARHQ
jgi:hypothetical protein